MPDLIRPDWPAPANVHAFTTTRKGGFSLGKWSSLNLGDRCGDNPDHVKQNRELLRSLLPGDPRWLRQVHGNRVVAWGENSEAEPEADAIFSDQAGQVCAVLTADCLPVLFCNRAGTKVATAHAGWRGLVAGVLEATVSAMDCDPSELMVWLGPAIGPQAYEVGDEVYNSFVNLDTDNISAFRRHGDSWLTDLYQLARLALAKVGVRQIWGRQYYTSSDDSTFFSYRRDGITGRMVTLIWLSGADIHRWE